MHLHGIFFKIDHPHKNMLLRMHVCRLFHRGPTVNKSVTYEKVTRTSTQPTNKLSNCSEYLTASSTVNKHTLTTPVRNLLNITRAKWTEVGVWTSSRDTVPPKCKVTQTSYAVIPWVITGKTQIYTPHYIRFLHLNKHGVLRDTTPSKITLLIRTDRPTEF